MEKYGVQFFLEFDPILEAIYEDNALFAFLALSKLTKLLYMIKKLFLHCILQFRVSFIGFIVLLKELKLIIDEVYPINI